MLEYFSVAQRICLYLARISPQQTIDHLVYELSLGLHEDYAATESFFTAGEEQGGRERRERGGVRHRPHAGKHNMRPKEYQSSPVGALHVVFALFCGTGRLEPWQLKSK